MVFTFINLSFYHFSPQEPHFLLKIEFKTLNFRIHIMSASVILNKAEKHILDTINQQDTLTNELLKMRIINW